jgi:hypothetical protein
MASENSCFNKLAKNTVWLHRLLIENSNFYASKWDPAAAGLASQESLGVGRLPISTFKKENITVMDGAKNSMPSGKLLIDYHTLKITLISVPSPIAFFNWILSHLVNNYLFGLTCVPWRWRWGFWRSRGNPWPPHNEGRGRRLKGADVPAPACWPPTAASAVRARVCGIQRSKPQWKHLWLKNLCAPLVKRGRIRLVHFMLPCPSPGSAAICAREQLFLFTIKCSSGSSTTCILLLHLPKNIGESIVQWKSDAMLLFVSNDIVNFWSAIRDIDGWWRHSSVNKE